MAGYIWQVRQALLFLLRAQPEQADQAIELESHDDVVVSSASGKILTAIQGKHSFEGGTLNCRSTELWKTIRVWSGLAAKRRISDRTPLILCATQTVGKELQCLTQKSRAMADMKSLQKRLDAIAVEKKNKILRPAYQAWLSIAQGRRASLLQQITVLEAQPRLAQIDAKFDPLLRHMGVPPNALKTFRERLIGWFDAVLAARLGKGGAR